MRKIKEPKNKLMLTAFYLAVLVLFWYLKVPCLFKHFLNIECPGCGMTRAVLSALKFDFIAAFTYHPMFWSLPLIYLYLLFDGNLFGNKIVDRTILILISAGFILSWILKLV